MKKILLITAFAAVVMGLSGCLEVQVTPKRDLPGIPLSPEGEETLGVVNVNNWGFFLCNWPIVTGDRKSGGPNWFDDDSGVNRLMDTLTSESAKMGGSKVYNTYSQITNYGFIFFVRTVNLSGTVVK